MKRSFIYKLNLILKRSNLAVCQEKQSFFFNFNSIENYYVILACLKCIEKLLENSSNGGDNLHKKLLHNKLVCEYSLQLSHKSSISELKQEFDSLSTLVCI